MDEPEYWLVRLTIVQKVGEALFPFTLPSLRILIENERWFPKAIGIVVQAVGYGCKVLLWWGNAISAKYVGHCLIFSSSIYGHSLTLIDFPNVGIL
jgi:hypothetical protein